MSKLAAAMSEACWISALQVELGQAQIERGLRRKEGG
jgi:hypothetical protein